MTEATRPTAQTTDQSATDQSAEVDATTANYPGLNALRAMGAIMVVTTHTAFNTGEIIRGWRGGLLARMDFGVAIFFVLSGFLLSRPFLLRAAQGRGHPRIGHYLWKRALRILPLYWVTMLLVWFTVDANRGVVTDSQWLRNLTLTQLYAPDLLPHGLTQMWSLATEAAFYLTLPLLMALLLGLSNRFHERQILVLLAVLSVGGIAWQAWAVTVPGSRAHVAQWLPGYLPWFCAGIALATLSVGDTLRHRVHVLHRMANDPAGCWIVATLIFALAATPLAGPRTLASQSSWEAAIKFTLYTLSASLLVLPLVFGPARGGLIRRVCSSRIAWFLGEISFGIFCLHLMFLDAIMEALDVGIFEGHFIQVLGATLGATIVAAWIAHYVVERPLSRFKNLGFSAPAKAASATAENSNS